MKPSITLACIMKNEASNIPTLLKSVEGCVDEIVLTDTGSTDDSVEVAKRLGAKVTHFEWINDFAAARNFSFKDIKTDYVMWLDLDDVLEGKEGFLNFKNDAMGLADYWIAAYHYSSDANGKAVCTFARERVFKTSKNFQWKYFVHEGVIPVGPTKMNQTTVWSVRHKRTAEDVLKDKARNLGLFEKNLSALDARMLYYHGKEYFEAQRPAEAIPQLGKALADPTLQMHDRVLAMQYLSYCYLQTEKYEQAMQIATQGNLLVPHRAEFYNILADCYLKQNRLQDAIPALSAAKSCFMSGQGNAAGPMFNSEDAYTIIPRVNLAKIYAQLGNLDQAEIEITDSVDKYNHEESKQILTEIQRIKGLTTGFKNAKACDDIVITCPPQAPYLWDADIAKEKSMGGSETAAIEMAYWLHKNTGRAVKIFNVRDEKKTVDGVDYIPCSQVTEYMSKYKPWVHIAWRHNIKLTDAPTYLWCHDLYTPGGEHTQNYDKMFCLTPFHKRFVMASQGVPSDKIITTRNGIKPDRFTDAERGLSNPYLKRKNPNKIVFPSSPDRGLDRAMRVLDEVRKFYPDIELHVFYGIEHLHKWGHAELQKTLEVMIKERPWVKYHGATQQDVLMEHFKEAVIWLHPCDFIESSCITAMEMVCAGVYPVTRRLGGLMDTLSRPEKDGMATLIDADCITSEEYNLYIAATLEAIRGKYWERVNVDPTTLSWDTVSKEWLQIFEGEGCHTQLMSS